MGQQETATNEPESSEQKPEDLAGDPVPTERDFLFMHLFLAQLDIFQYMQLAQFPGTEPLLKEAADRYWEAFTRGWGRERHARVFLLQCLDQADQARMFMEMFAKKARERLNGSVVPTPLDPTFELFETPQFRDSFANAVRAEKLSDADVVRGMYSRAYPLEARRLSDGPIGEALHPASMSWSRSIRFRRPSTARHRSCFEAMSKPVWAKRSRAAGRETAERRSMS